MTAEHQVTRDLFGNPVLNNLSVTQGNQVNNATGDTYTYNNANQLIQENNSLKQIYKYTYNDAGLLQTYTDYSNTVFTYTYDANNQIVTRTYLDKTGKKREQKLTYFPLTHQLKTIEEIYDGESQGLMQYTYALNGRLTSIIYPDGKKISWEYDEKTNLLTKFTDVIGKTTQ
ncbi:MAG: hypothetical protein GBAus27B_000248 [Mycoplasmataceae bacterium]|nr:MAG: hypothetical protein GBAus27B_000248 [Mycoplasmataceae bacterium]